MTQPEAGSARRAVGASDTAAERANEFRLLLATTRPAVHAFFVNLGHHSSPSSFVVTRVQVTVEALDAHAEDVAAATTAAVDVSLEQAAAAELCEALHARRPDLPVTAIVCCPHSLTPWNLRALIGAGVSSVVDLQATSEEALRALQSVARGGAVLHLQSLGGRRGLKDILAGGEPRSRTQIELLGLVARGLLDDEIGRHLHRSPHTVKHHIESLRATVGAKNRIELAAWAGRNGFYTPEARRAAS